MNTTDDRRYYVTGLILPASLALAAVAPGGHATKTPALHRADAPTPAHARAYEHVYAQVVREFGPRTPGRNIIKDGFGPHQPATDAETVASIAVLKRMLTPAPAPAPTRSTTPTAASTVTPSPQVSTGGGGGLPSCASESGSNYSTGASNTNSSSGATGRYQITPSTAANYGCNLSTPGGQDACAQTIYANQGASAWVGCGG
jgi:hypothetical protein